MKDKLQITFIVLIVLLEFSYNLIFPTINLLFNHSFPWNRGHERIYVDSSIYLKYLMLMMLSLTLIYGSWLISKRFTPSPLKGVTASTLYSSRAFFLYLVSFTLFLLYGYINFGISDFILQSPSIRSGVIHAGPRVAGYLWQFQYFCLFIGLIVLHDTVKNNENWRKSLIYWITLISLILVFYLVGSRMKFVVFVFALLFFVHDTNSLKKLKLTLIFSPILIFFVAFGRSLVQADIPDINLLLGIKTYDRIAESLGYYYAFQQIVVEDLSVGYRTYFEQYVNIFLRNTPSLNEQMFGMLYGRKSGMPPGAIASLYLVGKEPFVVFGLLIYSMFAILLFTVGRALLLVFGSYLVPYLFCLVMNIPSFIRPSDPSDLRVFVFYLLPLVLLPVLVKIKLGKEHSAS